MKKILQRSERGVALLLALLMAVSLPASVLAANPIVSEVKDTGQDLDYTFTETTSEDGRNADVQLEVIEKNENILTEITMPDGTVIYPEAKDGQDGFKQSTGGVEGNVIHYTASENGTISFKLKYVTQEVSDTNQSEASDSEETEFTDDLKRGNSSEEISTENQSESVDEENEMVPETEQNTEMAEPQENSEQDTDSQIDTEQNLLSKVVDTIFPVMEVQAADIESQAIEKEMIIEYEVVSLNSDMMVMKSVKSGGAVTTFGELKAAIADANDGDTIRIDGIISVPETIIIDKNITLEGGTLIKEGDFCLINVIRNCLQLSNIVLDGNRDNISSFKDRSASLIKMNTFSRLITNGDTILQNNYNCNSAAGYVGSAIGCQGFISNVQIIINEGTIIQNNETNAGGGGIGLFATNSQLIMNGGVVQNNNGGSFGGGIVALGNIGVRLLGGTITNNTAGYGAGVLCTDPRVGGDINIIGNTSTDNGAADDLYVEAEYGGRVYLVSEITGRVGLNINSILVFPALQDVVIEEGFDPNETMVESKMGSTANFFSDNPDYITRLEPDGDNHKIVLGFPKVTYDTKGGDFATGEEQEFYTSTNQPITKPNDPTLTDHAFVAWYTTSDYQEGTEFDFNTTITKDTTLYAKWFPDVYYINFNANGGTGTMDTIVQDGLQSVNLPANTFTNGAFLFDGWNTEADGSGTAFTDGQTGYTPGKKDVTLYAQWKERTYTVKYDTNGGTPATIADKGNIKFTDSGLLPTDTILREGYTLTEWKIQGTNTKVANTTKYSELVADYTISEVTLEAQWVAKTYTVKYDTNGGTPTAIADKTNVKFKDTGLLPADAPTRPGYILEDWEVNGNKVIDSTSYHTLVADDSVKSITLTAKWNEQTYTVKFALQDGERGGTLTGDTADQSVKYKQHAVAGAEVSANKDSAFIGWSYSYTPVGTTTPVSGTVTDYTTVPILNDVTFTAVFAKVPYVSGISTNGYVSAQKGGPPTEAGTTTATKIEYGATETLPADAGFKYKEALHYHINESKFKDSYNHAFTLDLNSTQTQKFTVGEDGATSIIQITLDKADKTVNITGIKESLQFQFLFEEDTKYSVSFKGEKSAADNWGQNTGLFAGDAMGNAPATNPTKPGYTFDGWSSDGSNAQGKMYDPNAQVTDKDEVYYAVWTPKEYTVHYNTDGGTAVADKTGVHYSDTGLTPTDNPTKNGYTFAGWEKDKAAVDADTAYQALVADDTVMEVTLTAKWDVKHFTAVWTTKDGETLGSIVGGNQQENGIAYNANVTKDVTATPASNDSEFIGWDYSYIPDGSTTPVTGFTDDYKSIAVLGDITFTAKFAAKPFVSIGATNGKVTAAKGTTPQEIGEDAGTSALVQYTAAEDIVNNKGTVSLKYGADMHHHLSTISFKDTLGHEYT
ncbi:MAG: InlB B-repeat-containing protein, partial [Clostridium sp.]